MSQTEVLRSIASCVALLYIRNIIELQAPQPKAYIYSQAQECDASKDEKRCIAWFKKRFTKKIREIFKYKTPEAAYKRVNDVWLRKQDCKQYVV